MKRKRILLLCYVAFAIFLLAGIGWIIVRGGFWRAHLQVEARVANSVGEQQPVSSATLYLLSQDMMRLALVREGEMSPLEQKVFRENPDLRTLAGLMNGRRREAYSLGPDVTPFMEKSRPLWQPHVVQTSQTDTQGRATFDNLKPGDYWLMARTETPNGGVAFWNLTVSIGRGENGVRLDPGNSLQCSGCR